MNQHSGSDQDLVQELASQLAASEARLRDIIQRSPDAFLIVDGDGTVQFANQAAAELFGSNETRLVGRPFGVPVVTGETTDVDIVTRQGDEVIAEMRVVETEWGGRKAHVAVLRDVTDRARTEQALRESEKRLTLAMEAAQLNFWDLDLRTGAVIGDEKLLASLGYAGGEVEPWPEAWDWLIHPDDLPGVQQAFEDHLQGKTRAFRREFRLRSKAGEWCWISFQGEVVERDAQGNASRVIGVIEDIAERKRAQIELETTQAQLHLAAAVARLGFWEWNPQTDEVYFSAEWKRQLGYTAEELPDRFEEFASRLHPEDRERILAAQSGLARISQPELEMEYRLRRRDGGYRWIASRVVQIRDETGRLTKLLGTHLDITERKEIEERIRLVSQHDPLTGLPNRALLYEFAEHLLSGARRDGTSAAFLFVDLDRFKPINDTYGHDVGDTVLKEVAKRLTACIRGEDLVARLGGDEFLAVISHLGSADDAAKAAVHALESLACPYRVDGLELTVTPSIGISLFPQDGQDVDDLIKNADTAMYHTKERRHNDFQFFKQEFNERAQEGLRIESRLRQGLTRGEFVLYYQAVMDTETEAVVGAEALLRWPGMQSGPERFIPVAEKAGFMPTLGEWVMEEACRQQREWHDRGLPSFPVAVNVSPVQFRQKHFADSVSKALEKAGLGPDDLRLEVTESTVMQNVEEAAEVLQALQAMGIKVALDDFGTGYSSLSCLSQLPIDTLKLDQSFIKNVGRSQTSVAVAEGVIALGKSLGLEVIAEGIESDEVLAFLKTRQCRRGQGFHFCRPMPATEFEQWCRREAANG